RADGDDLVRREPGRHLRLVADRAVEGVGHGAADGRAARVALLPVGARRQLRPWAGTARVAEVVPAVGAVLLLERVGDRRDRGAGLLVDAVVEVGPLREVGDRG